MTVHERVLPWIVVNDIRSSLAAVRFLISPLYDETGDPHLAKAAKELSRIEELISNGNLKENE